MRLKRSEGSKISSNSCFSSMESCKLAAIMSVSLADLPCARRDHGLVVQRLAKLYILLKQRSHALHASFDLRVHLDGIACYANVRLHVTIGIGGLQQPSASMPSTRTLMFPSGSFRLCTM